MSSSVISKPRVVIVVKDGTGLRVYSEYEIAVTVVEPDIDEDGLMDQVWEPIVCHISDFRAPDAEGNP